MVHRMRGAKLLTRCRCVVVSENSSNLCCQITFRCGNKICSAGFFRWNGTSGGGWVGRSFGIHGERFLPRKDTIFRHRTMRRGTKLWIVSVGLFWWHFQLVVVGSLVYAVLWWQRALCFFLVNRLSMFNYRLLVETEQFSTIIMWVFLEWVKKKI